MIDIVIGAGYGDEGKGMAVDYYTKKAFENSKGFTPIVVRFGGGHQCSHRVVHKDKEHIFSNFGSGTLRGATTYWMKECTIDPIGFMNEYNVLVKKGCTPIIVGDPRCPITTPWDMQHNHSVESIYNHGSTGVGFGSTVARNESPHKLHLIELRNKYVLEHKINTFFNKKNVKDKIVGEFYNAVNQMLDIISMMPEEQFFTTQENYRHFIFEGNQGILLDHEYGFFPHVTRSNTMSRGARIVIDNLCIVPHIHYVSRVYSTRHGNGPFPGEEYKKDLLLQNMENEANKTHKWQGEFRVAPLHVDILEYAIILDEYTRGFPVRNTDLILTCSDHIFGILPVIKGGTLHKEKDINSLKYIHTQCDIVGDPLWSSKKE